MLFVALMMAEKYARTVLLTCAALVLTPVLAWGGPSDGVAVASAAPICPLTPMSSQTLAVLRTITVGTDPKQVAVNSLTDTVYVGNATTLSIVDGQTGVQVGEQISFDATSIGLNGQPGPTPVKGVAVEQKLNGRVFVALSDDSTLSADSTVTVLEATGTWKQDLTVGQAPVGVAIDDTSGTVYVSNFDDNTVSVITLHGSTYAVDATFPVGRQPSRLALGNGKVYVPNTGAQNLNLSLSIRDGTTTTTVPLPEFMPNGVAVDGSGVVYVTYLGNWVFSTLDSTGTLTSPVPPLRLQYDSYGPLAIDELAQRVYMSSGYLASGLPVSERGLIEIVDISGDPTVTPDLLTVGPATYGMALDNLGDNRGLLYVANDDDLVAVGQVSAGLDRSTGWSGVEAVVTVDAPQVTYDLDSSAVSGICFGSSAATFSPLSGDRWAVTIPPGSGTVPVTVAFKGGLSASAGNFTYVSPSSNSPASDSPTTAAQVPGEPTDVVALASDASALVRWRAPASQGSSAVTEYEVISSTGDYGCTVLAPALECDVSGLENGTEYSFTARAANGAGWGAWSAASSAVTPMGPTRPSIRITGGRLTKFPRTVRVVGSAPELVGERLVPWVRHGDQRRYIRGEDQPTVRADGSFVWHYRSSQRVRVYFTHEDVRSNSITIEQRRRR